MGGPWRSLEATASPAKAASLRLSQRPSSPSKKSVQKEQGTMGQRSVYLRVVLKIFFKSCKPFVSKIGYIPHHLLILWKARDFFFRLLCVGFYEQVTGLSSWLPGLEPKRSSTEWVSQQVKCFAFLYAIIRERLLFWKCMICLGFPMSWNSWEKTHLNAGMTPRPPKKPTNS